MSEEALKKRLAREQKAREEAEKLLEEKAAELYAKNKELETLFLQQKIERLQLFENSVVGIALSYEGILLDINKTFADLLGYEKDEIIGKNIMDITHPDDRNETEKRNDELHAHKIERINIKKRYLRKDGTYFWGTTNVNEVKDMNGNIKYHLAVIHNINNEVLTKEKLELTVDHLKEINQNLQQFAYIASHDLRAPLNGMRTIIDWLKNKELDTESHSYIEMLEERSSKMNVMIDEILGYSKQRNDEEHKELISTHNLVSEVVKTFEIPKNINIEIKENMPKIYANPTKIRQVFNNLIDNAIRFSNKSNALIRISGRELEDSYQFLVFDNGKGIREDKFESIFELYNDTENDLSNKNGIGLSLVKRIIDQYGGKIAVQSEPDLFTQFSLTFSKKLTAPNVEQ